MSSLLKRLERALRSARNGLARRAFSGRRGRKLVLDALQDDVVAMTIDRGDHLISFAPKELVGRYIYIKGHFDRDRVDELVAILDRDGLMPARDAVVFDIGANIGTQSVYFCLTGRVGRVVAVEPDPRNLRLLARNVADNGLDHRVFIAPCAVGDFAGTAELFRTSGNHGHSSLISQAHDGEAVEVVVRPMDAILDDAGVLADDVTLVWMDIEGAQPMACRSMTALLQRQTPLMMEFSPSIYGPDGTRAFIAFLAGYYERCIVFDGGARRQLKVADLPISAKQCDVLFLP